MWILLCVTLMMIIYNKNFSFHCEICLLSWLHFILQLVLLEFSLFLRYFFGWFSLFQGTPRNNLSRFWINKWFHFTGVWNDKFPSYNFQTFFRAAGPFDCCFLKVFHAFCQSPAKNVFCQGLALQNSAKFPRTPFFIEHLWWLLLLTGWKRNN